jgi:carboxyl-terminal processing protease
MVFEGKMIIFVFMFSRKKIFLFVSILTVLFGFKQADEYFEISKNLEIFSTVYKTAHTDYVDEVKPGELMKKGIDAMLSSLDPYTNFYTESQAEDAMIQRSGEYGGIGCRSIKRDNYIYITAVFKGLPADKAGIRVGDKILEINGKSFVGKNDEDVGDALRGSPNTKASLIVERAGKTIPIELTREEIKTKNVTYVGLINSETGYIRLDHFMLGAGAEVKESLMKLKAQGIKQVVLDLRDNGGGLLHEAVNIVNVFVGSDELVVESKGRSNDAHKTYRTLDAATDPNIPLVVLVNGHSASASEIVCGAIQDLDRGVVIGRNTFGKGLVQSVRPLSYRTQMKITIAKYYIPSGRCIQLLDYSHRNSDGTPVTIPDSLKKKFRTRNGRMVLDGGGVKPDVVVPTPKESNIITSLSKSYLIFDFATEYRSTHEDIGDVRAFRADDKLFEDFKKFVSTKTFSYLNSSEKALKELREKAKEENYLAELQQDLDRLENNINKAKAAEMDLNKEAIKLLLQAEISRRYFYEDAVFLTSFQNDPDVLKAVEVLRQSTDYNSILGKK